MSKALDLIFGPRFFNFRNYIPNLQKGGESHPLLRQKERFIARQDLAALIERLADNLVNITDETGEFLLRLDDGRGD